MGAAEKDLGGEASLTLQGRVWQRIRESSGRDDNRRRNVFSVGLSLVDW